MSDTKLRRKLYDLLETSDPSTLWRRYLDVFLVTLIVLNICCVILDSIDEVAQSYHMLFNWVELASVGIFTVEYLGRLWCCVESEEAEGQVYPRLKYATSGLALIDFLAILPFYLSMFFTIDLRVLRVLRLLRVLKLTRYSTALTMLLDVFREEANAFVAGFFILFVLLILAASGAYLAEHHVQPDKFGSIPQAMWWAVATLTTVGYGDSVPVTPIGKLFGAAVTVIGVGTAAIPAGILASGLADKLRRSREYLRDELRLALEDGPLSPEQEQEMENLRRKLGLNKRVADETRLEIEHHNVTHNLRHCPHCGFMLER